MSSRPWVRFWARMFDYVLFTGLLVLLSELFLLPPGSLVFILWLGLLLWIPLEAACLTQWGTTPGKALLNCRVEGGQRFPGALKRSFQVWFFGMGAGLFLLAPLFAYLRVRRGRETRWGGVEHGSLTATRLLWFIALFLIVEGSTLGVTALFVRTYLLMEEIDLKYPE